MDKHMHTNGPIIVCSSGLDEIAAYCDQEGYISKEKTEPCNNCAELRELEKHNI